MENDSELESVYQELTQIYKRQRNRLINRIIEVFNCKTTNPQLIYKLKVKLETTFMRDVNCHYKYLLRPTPDSIGCDLRELVFLHMDEKDRTPMLTNIENFSKDFLITHKKINHILTDLDDTLYPTKSLIETSGRDSSWKNREPYPGIIKFYELFYSTLPKEAQYTTVLTGSPLFLKETLLYDPKISKILGPNYGFIQGSEHKHEAIKTLLAGMSERPFYYFAPSSIRVGQEKFNRYNQYRKLFPEYRLIFIGDNGQGDLIAGKKMLQEQSDCIVCIHNIIYNNRFLFSQADINNHKVDRLYFFNNYLDLAHIFTYTLNIFTHDMYKELKTTTINDLEKGLKNMAKPGKNLYQHYICNESGQPFIERTVKHKVYRCKTRKNQ